MENYDIRYYLFLFYFRALKNAQAKLRSQQTANAQLEEQRRREEVRITFQHLLCTA